MHWSGVRDIKRKKILDSRAEGDRAGEGEGEGGGEEEDSPEETERNN
jgi:hypothetical protein